MYTLISPAKRQSFDNNKDPGPVSVPPLIEKSHKLAKKLGQMTADEIAELMDISDNLAELNYNRYQEYEFQDTPERGRKAAFAFQGDTYTGLAVDELDHDDLTYAQNHLGILSGLYGVVRPMDVIQAHRLEMGTKMPVDGADDLYEYWGTDIAQTINRLIRGATNDCVVNCASKEYFKAVDTDTLDVPVITPKFKEIRDGKERTIAIYAKRARGMMARFIVKNRITDIDGLKEFNMADYTFDRVEDDGNTLLFTRPSSKS